MLDWLLAPIDPDRVHAVGAAVSWHARTMVLAWGILAPLAVLAARFFKVLPGQDWPRSLDSRAWWLSHWIGQSLVIVLSVIGVSLVIRADFSQATAHSWLGFSVIALMVIQGGLGAFRGTKGGPTALGKDGTTHGDHYDMTPWRRMFEAVHKLVGYCALGLAIITIVFGLWQANGPVWMWITLTLWWLMLAAMFVIFQKRGMAVDTYQAIWGDDPSHPGNQRPTPGWGMRRLGNTTKGDADVRSDRGNRLRGH